MTKILLDNCFAQVTSISLNQSSITECFKGLSISHPHCEALISLYGGQVLSFKPTDHKDVLWLSEEASYQSGKAIRGGIPICWPWFGANDKQTNDVKSVNHGFARQVFWQVETIDADEHGVTLNLVLTGENQHPLWPNSYQLRQTLFFGQSFKQTLAMTNLSQQDAQYTTALHSYFGVSNPSNVNIETLTGVTYSDKLTDESNVQKQSVSCIGEIDREYHSSEKMVIIDNDWQRKIEIVSGNCQQWVLWNPGVELARTMADIHSGGEQEYVCLEAANTAWQALPAGATVSIYQEILITKL